MFSALTFNIQNGQPWDEENPESTHVDLSQTIEFLRSQDADILFLQEVERGYDGGLQIDPPPNYQKLREALTGYDSVFAYPLPNPLEIPFGLGLAIFSKTPLSGLIRQDLPPADITFEYEGVERKPSSRLFLGTRTIIEGRSVRLANTHLQAYFMINSSSDKHCTQRNRVVEELQSESHLPTLLGGDFNYNANDCLVEQFSKAGYKTGQHDQITWRRMPLVLDHIFYNTPLRLESCRVIPTLASDHHAVRSEFSFS